MSAPYMWPPMREQNTQTDRESHDTCTYDTYTKNPFVMTNKNNNNYIIR